jgi:DNA-binding transcriptional LysR family regulator
LDADLLKAFLAVAETGGFSSAAKRLHLTQSAVSLQIKRLEERVGTSLFARTSRSVVLTDAGATLLPFAQRILRLGEEAEQAVVTADASQTVRIGMTDEQAVAYLPYILPIYKETHPDARLEVVCGESPQLVERVHDGLLDVAIAIRHPGSAGGTVIGGETLRWVADRDFRLAPHDPVPLAVNPEGCVYRAIAIAALHRAGRPWRVAFTSASPTGANIAVRARLGVAVKAERALPEGCRFLGEADGLPALGSVAVEMHSRAAPLSEPMRAFRDLLLEAAERHEGFVAAV